jgi:hypothetical protein
MSSNRKLPNWLDAWMEYTSNVETAYLYRKWVGLMCISSAMQRKVRVEWGVGLTFFPNLYIILVGKSATGKGTAMRPAMKIMKEIPAIKLSAQSTSLQALISSMKNNNLTDVNADGTTNFHSSMTVYSEEFTVFLGYKNNELISTLCNWYDCEEEWNYDTIKRGDEKIHGVWVTLIGGTTPDLIRSSLPPDSIGGGLTSRIIFVYAKEADCISVFPTETVQQREQFKFLVRDLEDISLMTGEFSWTEKFMSLWADWRHEDLKNPPFHDSKFDGYCGRRKVHLMKLAMIVSASTRTDLLLTEDCLKEAINILVEVEQTMALTFKGMGKSDIADLMFRANMMFAREHRDEIPYSEFARQFESDADKPTLDRLLDSLEAVGTVQLIHKPQAENVIKILRREV